MINSKDTKVLKELVASASYQITDTIKAGIELKEQINKTFDIVIREMEQGKI